MNEKLPVISNLFAKKAMQKYLAKKLKGKELQIFMPSFGDDGQKIWEAESPQNLGNGCAYYGMIGTKEMWVFAPSMEGIPFRVNGDWFTVCADVSFGYDAVRYIIAPLTTGDEAYNTFDRLCSSHCQYNL